MTIGSSAVAAEGPGVIAKQEDIDVGSLSRTDLTPTAVSGFTKAQLGTEPETIQPLPPPPSNLAGSSSASGKNYHVTVSNKAGYLCHVFVEANWPVSPEVPFAVFTHPDNSALFRDVKRVGARKVLKTEPGYKEVQVEQLGDIQVFWLHRTYSTWLHVVEDTRDHECLRITFDLMKSDVLGKFSGRWELRPVRDPATGLVVGCRGELNQDVLPKGMPSFMARLPVLGGALRGISVRAVTRVLEDFNAALEKVLAGHAAGRSTEAVLRELCGPVSEAAHANGAVNSFAFDTAEGEDDEEEEEEVEVGTGNQEGRASQVQASFEQAGSRGGQTAVRGLETVGGTQEQELKPEAVEVEPEQVSVPSTWEGRGGLSDVAGTAGATKAVTVVATSAEGAGSG